ncbi:MAG: T9SS type A sorting domain-containing protein [bacterium]
MRFVCSFVVIILLAGSAFAAYIPMGTAQNAADWAAESTWGTVTLLEAKTLLRPDETPSAYCFIFGYNGVTTLDESIIDDGYQMRQIGLIAEGWDVARGADSYCYVIVSSDNQYGPVLEMCDGLPAHKIFREDVKDMGELIFGSDVEIFGFYYLAPLENWYRVSTLTQSIIVNPRRAVSIEESEFVSYPTIYNLASNPTAPHYWEFLTTLPVAATDDEGYIPDVPNFNQEDTDCGPHSSAQAAGYWDDHQYMGGGPWDLLIDTDFWGLRDEMRSAMGWVPGSGVTMDEIRDGIETVCNDAAYNNNYNFDVILYNNPAYSVPCDAVDAGRPGVIGVLFHPIYGNHAMTVVGYNDTPTQMIQVHDNWPPSNDEPMIDWGTWMDGFVDVFPDGGGPTQPITLATFSAQYNAGAVQINWTTASEAECYSYNLIRNGAQINSEPIFATGGEAVTTHYHYTDNTVSKGNTYTYELQTTYIDGRSEISAAAEVRAGMYNLSQNIPNPFNPTTTISYEVPSAGSVKLTVYDIMGQQIASLVNGYQEANAYKVTFNAANLASGIYIYKLETGDFISIKKMVLMK